MPHPDEFRLLKMQVQRRLAACLLQANQHFNQNFPMPTVSYDLRGVKAGTAYLQKNLIKLNRTLLQENPTEFIRQVVPHELAHLIVYQLFGRVKPHGVQWQTVMREVFRLPAETYHRFALDNVQGQTFPYACQCQIHQLTARRHQKVQRESAVYFCKKCRTPLNFVKNFDPNERQT
ncbi:SprT family zinc-dependent metalloprotease [Caviibacterium pharyngocola]|uniref:Protein SprT n=1 Tax=Caviibacterium pharyngocola TaxID=28159 RepID=A0A2M8RX69_9PAST|nr:SprT family zinc-dependent metalloprotease [Caviibacterium pharyngocola]PJG83493.1 SprT family protein [Caviibacterium pharyngocola]